MGVIHKVTDHLEAFLFLEPHAGGIGRNDETRRQEHRSAILARPVPII